MTPHKPKPGKAAHRALSESLRQQVLNAEISPGGRLPTEAELTERHGVSRQTVRRALQDLVNEGLIYRVPGRGTFATTAPIPKGTDEHRYVRSIGTIEDLLALADDTEMEIIDPVARRVDVDLAGRLRLSSDQIVAGSFRRTYDGETFCLTRFALPPDLGQRLLRARQLPQPGQSGHITIIGLLENRLGVPIAAAHQSATASAASGAIATELGLTSGQPVLRIDRLYFDATGRPVEIAVSHFNPRLYTYRLELRRAMTHAPAMDA